MTSQRPLFPPEPPFAIGDYAIRQVGREWRVYRPHRELGYQWIWSGDSKEAAIEYAKYRAGITQA